MYNPKQPRLNISVIVDHNFLNRLDEYCAKHRISRAMAAINGLKKLMIEDKK